MYRCGLGNCYNTVVKKKVMSPHQYCCWICSHHDQRILKCTLDNDDIECNKKGDPDISTTWKLCDKLIKVISDNDIEFYTKVDQVGI